MHEWISRTILKKLRAGCDITIHAVSRDPFQTWNSTMPERVQ
jgi:hypothetical protein